MIPKKHVTHGLSYNRRPKLSVNKRVREDELPEVMYGHAILRFLHLVHNIHHRHPNKWILANKTGIEKAYLRLHTKASIATK